MKSAPVAVVQSGLSRQVKGSILAVCLPLSRDGTIIRNVTDGEDQKAPSLGSGIGSAARKSVGRARALADLGLQRVDGHARLSAWVVLARTVVREQGQTRASLAAAGAAFWLVIALFPAVIAVVSIFGLVVTPEQAAKAVSDLGKKGSGSLAAAVSEQAEQLSSTATSSLTTGLIISLIVTLWSVSNGAYNLARAVQLSSGLPVRGYLGARLRGFVGAIIGVLAIGVLAFVVSYSSILDDQLTGAWQVVVTWLVVVPLTLAVALALLVGLYWFALGRSARVRSLVPGAVLATLGLAGLHIVLDLIVRTFGSSSAAYGIAAGVVSALVAVYIASYIILLGAIVNANWPATSLFRPAQALAESGSVRQEVGKQARP